MKTIFSKNSKFYNWSCDPGVNSDPLNCWANFLFFIWPKKNSSCNRKSSIKQILCQLKHVYRSNNKTFGQCQLQFYNFLQWILNNLTLKPKNKQLIKYKHLLIYLEEYPKIKQSNFQLFFLLQYNKFVKSCIYYSTVFMVFLSMVLLLN